MEHVYKNLIINGRKTIDDVPEQLKDKTIALLEKAGYFNP